jgi:hypothetical protein
MKNDYSYALELQAITDILIDKFTLPFITPLLHRSDDRLFHVDSLDTIE